MKVIKTLTSKKQTQIITVYLDTQRKKYVIRHTDIRTGYHKTIETIPYNESPYETEAKETLDMVLRFINHIELLQDFYNNEY